MTDIVKDVSTITTIPYDTLNKLNDKVLWSICNSIYESKLNNEEFYELDLGFGTLIIADQDESIRYKFIPSAKLEKSVISVIKDNKNPLQNNLENSLKNKIINTYKTIV